MKNLHKKDYSLVVFFSIIVFLIFLRYGSLIYLRYLDRTQVKMYNRRYTSYLLTDELRQSSNDLTNMVRMYVITKDLKYKNAYYDILKIRNGEIPRPENYHQIYWDLVFYTDKPIPIGEKISLKEKMIKEKFTLEEFNILADAIDESDDLADMEEAAINAVEGKYDDGSGQYLLKREPDPELAKRLVFGEEYMKAKARIMAPIQEFLSKVESRTLKEAETIDKKSTYTLLISMTLGGIAAFIMIFAIIKTLRSLSRLNKENEDLLLNILPTPIAERLKEGEKVIADKYPQVSVLFADVVNFTKMTKEFGPEHIVEILNDIFERFDSLTNQYHIEKIKTIGDNYMAVAGVPSPDTNHAINLADFALAIREKLKEYNHEKQLDLKIRMGMSYGTVIAGVIGQKKFVYDLWGDGVNIASRMESTGEEGKIQVSEKLKMLLEEDFDFEGREEQMVKGVGTMKTFFLIGRKKSK